MFHLHPIKSRGIRRKQFIHADPELPLVSSPAGGLSIAFVPSELVLLYARTQYHPIEAGPSGTAGITNVIDTDIVTVHVKAPVPHA